MARQAAAHFTLAIHPHDRCVFCCVLRVHAPVPVPAPAQLVSLTVFVKQIPPVVSEASDHFISFWWAHNKKILDKMAHEKVGE